MRRACGLLIAALAACDVGTTAGPDAGDGAGAIDAAVDAPAGYQPDRLTMGQGLPPVLPVVKVNVGGATIDRDVVVPGTITVYEAPDATLTNLGAPSLTAPIGFQGRGNFTWSLPKKGYAFELQDGLGGDQARALLGLPPELLATGMTARLIGEASGPFSAARIANAGAEVGGRLQLDLGAVLEAETAAEAMVSVPEQGEDGETGQERRQPAQGVVELGVLQQQFLEVGLAHGQQGGRAGQQRLVLGDQGSGGGVHRRQGCGAASGSCSRVAQPPPAGVCWVTRAPSP